MKADHLSLVAPAFRIEEAAEVADRVDLPTGVPGVALELGALLPSEDQALSDRALAKDDAEPRAVHRVDQHTNEGAARRVGQVHPEKVLQVPRAAGAQLELPVRHRQRRLLDRRRGAPSELR